MPFSQARFEAAFRVVQSCGIFASGGVEAIALHIFDTLPSTNQTVWDLLDRGATEGTVAIASQQDSGRGQWGRQWVSAAGGLYLSVGLLPALAAEQAAQLTLCTACGIAQALRIVPGRLSGIAAMIPVQLKWPNDLVLNGQKLGGILTETRIQKGSITKAVVGVGVNWTNSVPAVGINLQTYLESQPIPLLESLEMLAAIVLHGLLAGYRRWQQGGIEPLLPDYLELLSHRDRPIDLNGQSATIIGITANGELRVQLKSPEPPTVSPFKSAPPPNTAEILLKPGTISLGYDLV